MVNRTDYREKAVSAARSVLIELSHLLGEYRDQFVIVGGWVPELLINHPTDLHVGSLDVDIAVDHRNVPEETYRTLEQLLLNRGYAQGKQPFIFHRTVGDVIVQVDFLSGEYGGTGGARRHQAFQDLKARKARGADLAFELSTSLEITGALPGGGNDRVEVRVASLVAFIVMKAEALAGRLKEKDAWDIDYCLRHFDGGLDAVAEAFKPHMSHGLVREALEILSKKYESVDSVGPMVRGLDLFREHFKDFADRYVLIDPHRRIIDDMRSFLEQLPLENVDLASLGLKSITLNAVVGSLRNLYRVDLRQLGEGRP